MPSHRPICAEVQMYAHCHLPCQLSHYQPCIWWAIYMFSLKNIPKFQRSTLKLANSLLYMNHSALALAHYHLAHFPCSIAVRQGVFLLEMIGTSLRIKIVEMNRTWTVHRRDNCTRGPLWKWSFQSRKERQRDPTGMYYIIFPQPDITDFMDDGLCW